MNTKRITAILPLQALDRLEASLRRCGIPGVTVERVQGYGKHPNYFRRDLMQRNARVIVYADDADVEKITQAIVECARDCGAESGILTVEPIERLIRFSNAHAGDQQSRSG